MTFTDDLALVLDLLTPVTPTTFYNGFMVWPEMYRKDRARTHPPQGSIGLAALGVVLGLFALGREFAWPPSVSVNGTNVLAAYDL